MKFATTLMLAFFATTAQAHSQYDSTTLTYAGLDSYNCSGKSADCAAINQQNEEVWVERSRDHESERERDIDTPTLREERYSNQRDRESDADYDASKYDR